MSYSRSENDTDWTDGKPRHRWLGFLRATSSIGVLAGVTAGASAVLPYAGIALDPRVPVITGSGAPFVFGAGIAMVAASLVNLWWVNSRIKKPLDQLHVAVDGAVEDGFYKRLQLPNSGIGPILTNAADRLQDITVSITDAGLEDGERRLRMVFRDDAATKFQGILSALGNVHDGIVEREAERDEQQRAMLERTAKAAHTLEQTAALHHKEQTRLSKALQGAQSALGAIHSQLTNLQQIDPQSVNIVMDKLSEQTRSIVSLIDANSTAREEVGQTSNSLRETGDELRNSFTRLKRELEETADNARNVTQSREAMLVDAVSNMRSKLTSIETSLDQATENVSLSGQKLRDASDAMASDQARNQAVFAQSLNAFSSKTDSMLETAQSDLKQSITATHIEMAKSIRDSGNAVNESLATIDRSVSRRLEEIEDAAVQFDRTITTAFRDNQSAVEASMSWLDRSIAGAIDRNQGVIERSTADMESSITKALERNRTDITGSVASLTDTIGADLEANREKFAASAEKFEGEMARRMTDGQDVLAEAMDKLDRLVDAASDAESRLSHAVDAATGAFEQSADTTRESLATLTRQAADRIEALIGDADTRLTEAAEGAGNAAIEALKDEMQPVREASDEHAEFLRSATAQMRAEADRLGEAQQASEIVRSMSKLAEEQLRDVSKTLEEKSDAAMQAFERAAHDIEHRSKSASERLEKVHVQAGKSNELMANSIEPLAGLLGRTRTMLENISEIEESHLAPSLRRIQSSLRGISTYIEDSSEEQTSRMTDAVREEVQRAASGIIKPVEDILPAVNAQNDKLVQMEIALSQAAEHDAQLPPELTREIGEFCANQIAAANDRLEGLEGAIEKRLNVLGKAIEQVRDQAPQHIEKAVDLLATKLEERSSVRQAGLEAAFTMLQSSIESQLVALSEAREAVGAKEISVDEKSIATAASKAVESGISKLADDLKGRLETMSANVVEATAKSTADGTTDVAAPIEVSQVNMAANAPLDQQIIAIQGLIEAVEKQAVELAQVATESPELLEEMPEASAALTSAENALAAWTRQIDNVSTAVAIAKDASHSEKQAA